MPEEIISDIEFYKENHAEEMHKFKTAEYSLEFMPIDEFCQIYKKEIEEDIKKQEAKHISMKDIVKNAISNGLDLEQVEQMDRVENVLSNERNEEGVTKDE